MTRTTRARGGRESRHLWKRGLVRADTSDSWWAGSWLRAGGHQISGSVDMISGHDTLVGNDGRGSFGWVGLVCHANQLIRKEPRGEVCQKSWRSWRPTT
jgi:hypothetical protein